MRTTILTRLIVGLSSILLLAAGPLAAQDFQGKFTLPLQAQWGQAVLQQGSYTLVVGRTMGGLRQLIIRSEGKGPRTAVLTTQSEINSHSLRISSLVCVHEGGALVVRAFEIAPLGVTLEFPMPKGAPLFSERRGHEKETLLAGGPQLIERVAVERSGK